LYEAVELGYGRRDYRLSTGSNSDAWCGHVSVAAIGDCVAHAVEQPDTGPAAFLIPGSFGVNGVAGSSRSS
jgi:hypothetical protein